MLRKPLRLAFALLTSVTCACTTRGPARDSRAVVDTIDPPLAGTVAGNPVILQSRFGQRGNYELIVPSARGGLLYYWRNNNMDGEPWNGPLELFADQGIFDAVAMQQNGAVDDEMDVVARQGDSLFFLWRDKDPQVPWHAQWREVGKPSSGLVPIAVGVSGIPSLVAWKSGALDAVVPRRDGGIATISRGAGVAQGPWVPGVTVGVTRYDALSLAQTDEGGLALAAQGASGVDFYARAQGETWLGPTAIHASAAGAPALLCDTAGTLTLMTPAASGGVELYAREKGATWHAESRALPDLGRVDALSLFASNLGTLEIATVAQSRLQVSTRNAAGAWANALTIATPIDETYPEPAPELTKGYWEYLGPLTSAASNDEASVGILGTDLGQSYETADGRLAFLFGDSYAKNPSDASLDSIAYTDAAFVDRLHLPKITWATRPTGDFFPFDPPGIPDRDMNVPVEGLTLGGRELFFFTTDFHRFCADQTNAKCLGRHSRSVLAATDGGDPRTIHVASEALSQRFININAIPENDGFVYLYGAGSFRQSAVFLARVRPDDIGDRTKWSYYRGLREGVPTWGPGELTSAPLFRGGVPVGPAGMPLTGRMNIGVGEFSVRKHPTRPLYLMTYKADGGCGGPPGVHLRTARTPWGPWTAPIVLFNRADVYGHFVHKSSEPSDPDVIQPIVDDGLARPGLYTAGGLYGPYLIPRWFRSEGNIDSIVFAISSWTPYQVHLVRAVVSTDGTVVGKPNPSLPFTTALVNGDFARGTTAGWTSSGDPFTVLRASDGSWRVTTSPASQRTAVGSLSQELTVDDKVKEVRFALHGGTNASVRLYRRGDLVRETTGRDDDQDLAVAWNLEDFRGETLKLVIRNADQPKNALTVSGFAFH
jgi:hypothetical protein